MPEKINITDHAVLRYLERCWGVDVETLRKHIAREVEASLAQSAQARDIADFHLPTEFSVLRGGARFNIVNSTVVTIIGNNALLTKRAQRIRGRK